jgi:hypothetical protein
LSYDCLLAKPVDGIWQFQSAVAVYKTKFTSLP